MNTEDNTDGYLAYLDTRPKREREMHDATLRFNSYSRAACLSAFLGYLDEECPSEARRVVTDNWDGCDNLNLYRKSLTNTCAAIVTRAGFQSPKHSNHTIRARLH